MADLTTQTNVLLQAPVGSGKTIIFNEIVRRYLTAYPHLTIAIVAHMQELCQQAYDKMIKVWPNGWQKLGLACASLGKVDTSKPVIIGSVQTLARRKAARPVDLLIVDECHHINALETGTAGKGQYHNLINKLKELNNNLRILGVSATPYRLSDGYIYGNECKPGTTTLFPRLNYQITIEELISNGYLSPMRAKKNVEMNKELENVKKIGGDYALNELDDLCGKEIYINAAVQTYKEHGENRRNVLVFAVSIKHAESLANAFKQAGYKATVVHSCLSNDERKKRLEEFERGDINILVNVTIVSEGVDIPNIDLIMLCRPTLSASLFCQMIGRGLRLAPEKKDLLVLDMAGNYDALGDPLNPEVIIPGASKKSDKKQTNKICIGCGEMIPVRSRLCPYCGHENEGTIFTEISTPPKMVEVEARPLGKSEVVESYCEPYVSFKGYYMLKLILNCKPGGQIVHYLDIEGTASAYGQRKARGLWWGLSGGKKYPDTVTEATERFNELSLPKFVTIKRDGRFKKVEEFC